MGAKEHVFTLGIEEEFQITAFAVSVFHWEKNR
jgi:hypothetical protein